MLHHHHHHPNTRARLPGLILWLASQTVRWRKHLQLDLADRSIGEQRSVSQASATFSVAGDKQSGSHLDDISEHSVDVGEMITRQNPGRASSRSNPELLTSAWTGQQQLPLGLHPHDRRMSLPYYVNMRAAPADRGNFRRACSSIQIPLCVDESPMELQRMGLPPAYTSCWNGEASNDSPIRHTLAWQTSFDEDSGIGEQVPPSAREPQDMEEQQEDKDLEMAHQ